MPTRNVARKDLPWGWCSCIWMVSGGIVWGGLPVGSWAIAQANPVLSESSLSGSAPNSEASGVSNADSACYLHSTDGRRYDLSALCAGFNASAWETSLQTGDVQVTLRWDTADDLDLVVSDPLGEEVSFLSSVVASGGQFDVDAHADCAQKMAAPVENIFWPAERGTPGDYVATITLSSFCGDEAPVDFTLTTIINGQTQTQSGTVSAAQNTSRFPFTFPAADKPAEATEEPISPTPSSPDAG